MIPRSSDATPPLPPEESPFTGSDVAIVLLFSLLVPGIAVAFVTELNALAVFGILLPSQWIGNGIGLYVVARRRRATETAFGLPILGRDFGGIGLGILAFIAILTVLGPIAEALDLTESGQLTVDAFTDIETPWVLTIAIINVCVLAPLMEELTYRGVLHGALRRRLGGRATVAASGLIFALVHVPGLDTSSPKFALVAAFTVFEVFLLALLLGFLREKDGRIGRAFFAHGAWNAVNLIAILSLPYLEGV
jgi:membrane protease YdiL (CAAX protease family)